MSAYNDARISHAEKIERTIDDIVEIVLSDSHVEHMPDEEPPVSAETWLAVKAKLLALLAEIIDD